MSNITLQLNRRHIMAALVVAGDQDIRYYLNGVLVEAYHDRIFIVGCDGSRMAVLRDNARHGQPVGDGVQFIIPRDLAKKVKAHKSLATISVTYDPETKHITFDDLGDIFGSQAIQGRFPDWRRALPSIKGELKPIHLNFDLMAGFVKVAKALEKKAQQVSVHSDNGTAGLVDIGGLEEFRGVIMGMRSTAKNPFTCLPTESWKEYPAKPHA